MTRFILREIPFDPQPETLLRSLRIGPGSADEETFLRLLAQARSVARPKAFYGEAYVEALEEETVVVSGVAFHSRALRLNLEHAGRTFPFVATCGSELDALPLEPGDFLGRFWLDAIKEAALEASLDYLNDVLATRYALVKTASMSPGSGDVTVWPIEQQRLLFALLGDVHAAIGVTLTESCLMIPNKTVSGLVFPTERAIRTCQVCRREGCPNRQATFDPAAWEAIQAG